MQTLAYKAYNGLRALHRWGIPYFNSLVHSEEFRPVLCYLFIDWRCNIDCHYCFQFDNHAVTSVSAMDIETAKSAIDWLKSLGCRVIPLMGGEPLMRKDFVVDVVRYGAENGFFMYLPTNGYFLDKYFIDEVGAAGVAAINLAVDCVAPKKGLPKALLNIEPQFRYLVEKQKKYGYILFFNINICRNNIADVKLLTEIAHQNRIGTDYHLNQPPLHFVDVGHYIHKDNQLLLRKEDSEKVGELIDWLIEKQLGGWPMVNHIKHLKAYQDHIKHGAYPWDCRAGRNGALIRTDGTLSPCFDLICYDHDWGAIWEPKFDPDVLKEIKKTCNPNCLSTCYYTMAMYYNLGDFPQWIRKHALVG